MKALLEQAGLDQHEIDLYLALVPLKEATAGQLSQKSGVPRTYTYRILEGLEKKGFVHTKPGSGIRRFALTDFEATKRYIEQQQLKLFKAHQEAQSLVSQLENLANPQVSSAGSEALRDTPGEEDFWKLLHSTLTREIWVINPPFWWGDVQHSSVIKKWERYRERQHIWEKRFVGSVPNGEFKYVEYAELVSPPGNAASIVLVDQYQVQVSTWEPFRALRIESAEMVDLMKGVLG